MRTLSCIIVTYINGYRAICAYHMQEPIKLWLSKILTQNIYWNRHECLTSLTVIQQDNDCLTICYVRLSTHINLASGITIFFDIIIICIII